MKHVGILAHSAEGSSLCYLEFCHTGSSRLGPHTHPDVTMDIISMGASMPEWERENLSAIRTTLSISATRLAASGCDFFICPDNTAHLALETDGPILPLPGLHIADVVITEAAARGYRKLGILGTKWITTKPMYFQAALKSSMEVIAPNDPDIKYINDTIFSELCNGIFSNYALERYVEIINTLKNSGCDAVILGCTEIPLLVSSEHSPLPILDSTRLLARYALEVAIGDRPLPTWRGGPTA